MKLTKKKHSSFANFASMYSKEQASQLKKEFWTTFGNYMSVIVSSEGLKTNWLNYKTGVKHVYFRMDADGKRASVAIEIAHPDPGIQELFFEQFLELKIVLNSYLKEDWEWVLHTTDESGKSISKISTEIHEVSIFNKDHWHRLISFFKPRIIALDEFWNDARDSFDTLK